MSTTLLKEINLKSSEEAILLVKIHRVWHKRVRNLVKFERGYHLYKGTKAGCCIVKKLQLRNYCLLEFRQCGIKHREEFSKI